MKTLSLATVLILVSGLCIGAAAQEGGGGQGLPGMRGMMGGMRNMRGMMEGMQNRRGAQGLLQGKYRGPNFYLKLSSDLGLDDSQVQKIKAIRMELVKQSSQVQSRLIVSRAELRDMLDSDNIDLAKAQAKVTEISGLRSDLLAAGLKARVEATRVLTDEQRKKVREMPRPRLGEGRMRPGRGGWMPGGGPLRGNN
ncbi:MAG: Spy/CpxP family protein refolding chaperone [Candidatus Glassbacteria bacterium]